MKSTLFAVLGAAAVIGVVMTGSADAAGKAKKPEYQDWSFAGPFGTYDRGALQRGFKVYREVCASCHAIELVAFRNLMEPGGPEFSEDEVKAIAAEYTIIAADPDEFGDEVERPGVPADRFPSPWRNAEESASANGGAAPPDLSLITKARAVERGFPNFVFDIFTQYQEQGPDYVHGLLTGYASDEPNDDGTYPNPYFLAGDAIRMAPPLVEGIVTYDDGTPETVEQYSLDVTHFLAWTAEPKLEERKALGLKTMVFLIIFAGLLYATKRRVFSSVAH
ncbi:MAG: cytochrome c1 [Pseudomonadota bacterium]